MHKKESSVLKEKINRWLPPFIRFPLLCVVVINFATYYGTKLATLNAKHYDLTTKLDLIIPFVPFFISIYVLAYLQWIFSYIYHTKQNPNACYTLATASIIAKVICALFFLFFPTEIQLPEITGNGIWEQLTQFIYNADTPRTLFPSVHCVESWFCFRGATYVKNAPKWYLYAQGIFSVLVFASTVLVKQHFIVDVFGGIAVAELGLFIAKKKNFGSLFQKVDLKFHKTL